MRVKLLAALPIVLLAFIACREDLDRASAAAKLNSSSLFSPARSGMRDLEHFATGLTKERCHWPEGEEVFARKVTRVTGLTADNPNVRIAEFQWQWDTSKISAGAAKCLFITENPGAATFVRYDDGWRVTEVNIEKGLY
jgi:hypothetical protein